MENQVMTDAQKPEAEMSNNSDKKPEPVSELSDRSQLMATWSIGGLLIGVITFIILRVALSDEMSRNSFLGVVVLLPPLFIPVIAYGKRDKRINSNDMRLALAIGIVFMILACVGVIIWDVI